MPSIADVDHALAAVAVRGAEVEPVLMKQEWTLAFPSGAVRDFCGANQAKAICSRARQHLHESLVGFENDSALDRSPLVFVTLGCTGIGKSRLGDEVGNLMFPDEQAEILKVTYNCAGLSTLDREKPTESFLWRMVAAASHKLPGLALVPTFLDVVMTHKWSITKTFAEKYLAKNLREDRPWVLVLDELVKGPQDPQDILSLCSWFVRLSALHPQRPHGAGDGESDPPSSALGQLTLADNARTVLRWRCALVTSLDFVTVEPLSVSGRKSFLLPQYLLDGDSSSTFARQLIRGDTKDLTTEHHACIRIAGGHPRSLVVAMELYQRDKRVPTAIAVANDAQFPDVAIKDLGAVIKRSYRPLPLGDIQSDDLLNRLFKKGALLFSPLPGTHYGSGWVSIPTAIIAKAVAEAKEQPYKSFECMLQHSASSPEKQLEVISVYSDISRAAMGMGVVPPLMMVLKPGERDWTTLNFAFDPSKNIVKQSVIRAIQNRPWELLCSVAACDSFYYPSATNHPAFESMYPAKFPDGTPVLVLRQEKINADVPSAIKGLNKAANLLQTNGKWVGLFLFVVTAMGASSPSSIESSDHPVLLVTANNTQEYFSPSFSTLAHVEFLVHLHNKGATRKSESSGELGVLLPATPVKPTERADSDAKAET